MSKKKIFHLEGQRRKQQDPDPDPESDPDPYQNVTDPQHTAKNGLETGRTWEQWTMM